MDKNIEYLILVVATLLISTIASFVLKKILNLIIKKNSEGGLDDTTDIVFLKNSISFICYAFGLFWIFTKIPYFQSLGKTLFASAGVLAAIFGFAGQKAISNIVGGIFILIFKPFRIGDIIETQSGHKGEVEAVTLRHTVIKDYEFRRVIIPNNVMSNDTIINSSITDKKIRKHIDLAISYNSDIQKAENVIREVIENHPLFIDKRTKSEKRKEEFAVEIKVVELGDFSMTLRAFVWTKNFNDALELKRDVLRSVKLAFDENQIEIPYPYRSIVMKSEQGLDLKK